MSQPFARLEETEDEDSVRILDAAAAGGKIAYTYDFGAALGRGPGVKEVEDGDAITLMKLAFGGR